MSAALLALLILQGCDGASEEGGSDAGAEDVSSADTGTESDDSTPAWIRDRTHIRDNIYEYEGVQYEQFGSDPNASVKYGTTTWLTAAFEADLRAGRDDRMPEFIHESAQGLLARLRDKTATPEDKAHLIEMYDGTYDSHRIVYDGFANTTTIPRENQSTGLKLVFHLNDSEDQPQFTALYINDQPAN
jgi:hypothetical protein